MIVLRTILYKTAQGLVALLIFFDTWTQCSSRSDVREVLATVKGFITITCFYDTYQYKNLESSWCRQISTTDCENIVQTIGFKPSIYKERVNFSQTMDRFGTVNVTIFNLQPWDSGLYSWRVWNGKAYNIIQTVLLQVIHGLPPNIPVARFKLHEMAELHCEYPSNIKKSKVWEKKINEKRFQWVAHSSGNIGTDYKSRVIAINDEQKKRLTVTFQQVELWDSGIYQCSESRSRDILTKILLIVTMDNETFASTQMTPMLSSGQTTKILSHSLPVNSESKSLSPADGRTQFSHLNTYDPSIFYQSSTLNNSYATQQPKSPHRPKPWNIMRWILLLSMVLCVVFFSYYKRSSEDFSGKRQIYKSRRSQIRNISKV